MSNLLWNRNWRKTVFSNINQDWDILIIGGGITGAGIFRTAVSAGLKTLLVDANDFAFGTSSRSSKLIHGGFRYLYNKQYHVTYESVSERQRLLYEAPHLVETLAFNVPNFASYHFPSLFFKIGLSIYDLMAAKWDHQSLSVKKMRKCIPGLSASGYLSGFRYKDAVLDDARLVFRIIRETVQDGGSAINYMSAEKLLRDKNGKVRGVALHDRSLLDGKTLEANAKVVINATGPWSDILRKELNVPDRLRPLRGSHLIFSRSRLPVSEAVTFFHPADKRAMFIIPWEGATLVGTTDIDHSGKEFQAGAEPFANRDEIAYILQGIEFLFPNAEITEKDILSSFAGLRPVINTGAATPSKESRAHQVWEEKGLITVSGGKLTTFRIMAKDTLEMAGISMGKQIKINKHLPMLKTMRNISPINVLDSVHTRLLGRSGNEAAMILRNTDASDLLSINNLPASWAELKFAAESEGIVHLDDLLLRRTRIGILLPAGGCALLPRIKKAVQSKLNWSDAVWQKEEKRYLKIWRKYYSPKPG